MHIYIVKIVMQDGSSGQHIGRYMSRLTAELRAADLFPSFKRISARRADA